jgi:hypothetical protein
MTAAPFVSEVLLYDRLIIPVQDTADQSPDELEFWKKFDQELLMDCLEILKVKTEKEDGLALTVPWNKAKRERFKNSMSVAAALATQKRSPEQGYYADPFELTRQLIKDEFRPALPPGVTKAWTVAAYTSTNAFREEKMAADPDRRQRLAALLAHSFLTPTEKDPHHELLKRAIDLAQTPEFHSKREAFYKWQEGIIEEDISDDKAVEEMKKLLLELDKATRKAFGNVDYRFLCTMIPIGLGTADALLTDQTEPITLAAASGLIPFARFWKFDRKPVIEAGDLDAAAMIHDAREVLPLA